MATALAKLGSSRLPLLLFTLAAALAAFLVGMWFEHSVARATKGPLYPPQTRNQVTAFGTPEAAQAVVDQDLRCAPLAAGVLQRLREEYPLPTLRCPAAHVARTQAAAARVEFLAGDGLAEPVLVKGEVGAFMDHCPGPWGCLAVQYSRSGSVNRAWPFRPAAISQANIAAESDYPYSHPEPSAGWSLGHDVRTFQIAPYPDGDLLIVFHLKNSHPRGGGVARVAPDGRPRWYRKDYSHQWPIVIDGDLALVPSMRLRQRSMAYRIRGHPTELTIECSSGIVEDQLNVVNGDGEVVEEIRILEAILRSNHTGKLRGINKCDPTHLNFAHVLGADAGGAAGIRPGNLVVSLRNLNAFAILDKDSRRLTRLVRGSFHRQHGVRHLEGARFVMFDNLGTDGVHGPSRLLAVDLATGQETTLFPNDQTPERLRGMFASENGQLDVSADRRRVLLADVRAGRAYEICISDGRVVNVFHQLHDVLSLLGTPPTLAGNAWLFEFHGIHYANGVSAEHETSDLCGPAGAAIPWDRG